MVRTKVNWGILCFFVFWAAFSSFASANISIEDDSEGTLLMSFPDGTIEVIEPGDKIPKIPSGSSIEVFDGHVTAMTEQKDNLIMDCCGYEAKLEDGDSAHLICAEKNGCLEALNGEIPLTDTQGNTIIIPTDLPEGEKQYCFECGELLEAAPTAAGDTLGRSLEPEEPPVDSRSIDVSPST